MSRASERVSSQLILGLIAIGVGLLFLLRNLGVLDADVIRQFWPLIFVVIGAVKILTGCGEGRGHHLWWGGAFILVGATMTLHRLGVIDFSWRAWWPLLLIGFGVSILFGRGGKRQGLPWQSVTEPLGEERIDATAIMGGYRRQLHTQNFRGGDVTAIMGGCELDFRNASIENEAVLNVMAFWGGIELKVPADWTVVLQGSGIMGGFEDKTRVPAEAGKRLIVRGYAIMGGFEVKN
ncbi:MAG: hypothetical protein IPL70_15955 [Uliginosibacterium sp.]|nr:hypothetical protein [Uliginosibacterium sp.]